MAPYEALYGQRHCSGEAARDQNVVVMQYDNRIDHMESLWVVHERRPWDLPLADEGRIRAWTAGKQLRDSELLIHRVVVFLFLRCLETSVEVVCALCCIVDDHQLLLSMETSYYVFLDPSHVKVYLIFPCSFQILLRYCCDSPIFGPQIIASSL
ncbi:uncharacterized protein LOC122029210 [Zingiber officinale]|uniref:uncharacterized protein LOC122029210 n=1 Tax=Zingiber officinale TaxID=94328 RepID=UPI001C4BC301|nr:uncharacterized protein LOC122029210 [Zingiber officinale]